MGTIVVGYVPKPEGEAALVQALEEARTRDAKVVVVQAHPFSGAGTLRDRLDSSGLEHEVRALDADADAAEAIMEVTAELGAELLVIGLRRRSPVGKLVLGSSAQRMLLQAPCPVLAVKA